MKRCIRLKKREGGENVVRKEGVREEIGRTTLNEVVRCKMKYIYCS